MSKVIEATCQASTVTIDGQPVSATILSKGIGSSEGIAVLDKDKVTYITSNATDLETTLDNLNQSLTKLVTILTAIGAGMTGPTTAPPPTLVADLAEITAIVATLTTLKGALK